MAFSFLLIYILLTLLGHIIIGGWFLMLFFVTLALNFRQNPKLKSFTFTTMIFAAVSLAMHYPQYFIHLGGFKLSGLTHTYFSSFNPKSVCK